MRIPAWLRLMRPLQWSKNIVVLAGVVFSGNLSNPELLGQALMACLSFCLVSSAMYVFNDWHDRDEDRLHPVKCQRPIASGEMLADRAFALSIGLLGAGLGTAALVSSQLTLVILAYGMLVLGYSLWFRDVAFVDILVIALGFVLRALAGTVAVGVSISVWLFVCTLLLALLLGLGKRAAELYLLQGSSTPRRLTLAHYQKLNLPRFLLFSGLATVSSYVMYTLAVPDYGRSIPMVVTAPFVAVAVGRYLWLTIREHRGSAPERLLFEDRWMLILIGAWMVSVAMVLGS